MKASLLTIAGVAALAMPVVAAAQTASPGPLTRADLTGSVGWLHGGVARAGHDCGPHEGGVLGGGAFGWYWTDHVKTQVQVVLAGSDAYVNDIAHIRGQRYPAYAELSVLSRRLALTELYQFGRNRWFHPYAGGGLAVVVDRTIRRDAAVYSYEPVTRRGGIVRDGITHPPRTSVHLEAQASAGFKGYVHRRAFVALEGSVGFRRRVEALIVGAGMGVDF